MSFFREHLVKALGRSPKWGHIRKLHLEEQSQCQVCGRTTSLEVHHIKDYSQNPHLELDPSNLITLCDGSTKCHFVFGHLGSWRSINPTIQNDAALFSEKFKNRR